MPIALIPELTSALTRVGGKLSPWDRLVDLEEQILRRARGAFLVQWFGRGVPEKRLGLHIAIVNIAALRARYELVRQSMPGPFARLNLFGPLAGMAGFAAGLFMSPSGVFLFAPHLHRVFDMLTDAWWGAPLTMFYALVGNWIMPALGPALGLGLLAPVGILAAMVLALSGDRQTHAIIRLLGDVAMMADAFLAFWDQLRGPVDQIRNPMVRAIMTLLGRMSVLFAHMLGFIGILLVRLAPLIPNLIAQFRAAMALGQAVIATLGDVLSGLFDTLMAPFIGQTGLIAVLRGVFDGIMALPGLLMDKVAELIDGAGLLLRGAYERISGLLAGYIAGVTQRIVAGFRMTPLNLLVDRILQLATLLPQVVTAIRAVPAPLAETGDDGWWSGFKGWVAETAADAASLGLASQVRDLQRSVQNLETPALPDISNVPDLPAFPGLPDAAALDVATTVPVTPDFAAEATRMLAQATFETARTRAPQDLLRRPRSAFADQRALLQARGAPVLTDEERSLRHMIYLAVGRALPAALRIHAPRIRALFDLFDQTVYPDAEPAPRTADDHPQLTLPDGGRLSPVVNTLTIRSPEGLAPDLRVFRDHLVEVLRRQDYRVLAAG